MGSREGTYHETGANERGRLSSHRRPHAASDSRSAAGRRRPRERARRRLRAEPARDLQASEGAQGWAPGHGGEGRTRAPLRAAPRAAAKGGVVARGLSGVLAAQPDQPEALPGGNMTPPPKRARAVADLGEGVVLARVEIAASPDRVFRALTTEELLKWWGADGVYRTTKFAIDPPPGGQWRTEGVGADGTNFHVEGQVLEIDPPRRLVQTWKPSWGEGAVTTLTYSLEPIDGGTRVTVRHTGFGGRPQLCEGHGQGWERVLGWLGAYLSPAGAGRVFLCRLLPPRSTFMQDMAADERAIMQAHGRYWQGKLAENVAIAFGPVADPSGGWGLGIVEVRDEAELHALLAADPGIGSGRGFGYEYLPRGAVGG